MCVFGVRFSISWQLIKSTQTTTKTTTATMKYKIQNRKLLVKDAQQFLGQVFPSRRSKMKGIERGRNGGTLGKHSAILR